MIIWSLFDGSGIMVRPWAARGHNCVCFNFDEADHGGYEDVRQNHPRISYVNTWIDDGFTAAAVVGDFGLPDIIFAFPPCTDLANSGSRHFARKREINPNVHTDAAATCRIAETLGNHFGVPYMIENPIGMLSSLWRRPDAIFDPYDFGGYLPEDDENPLFPKYIRPRDAYPKKTCLWFGNGFVMPERKPVAVAPGWSDQQKLLGGKSKKTKLIRSLTPRGFARAVAKANGAAMRLKAK